MSRVSWAPHNLPRNSVCSPHYRPRGMGATEGVLFTFLSLFARSGNGSAARYGNFF